MNAGGVFLFFLGFVVGRRAFRDFFFSSIVPLFPLASAGVSLSLSPPLFCWRVDCSRMGMDQEVETRSPTHQSPTSPHFPPLSILDHRRQRFAGLNNSQFRVLAWRFCFVFGSSLLCSVRSACKNRGSGFLSIVSYTPSFESCSSASLTRTNMSLSCFPLFRSASVSRTCVNACNVFFNSV